VGDVVAFWLRRRGREVGRSGMKIKTKLGRDERPTIPGTLVGSTTFRPGGFGREHENDYKYHYKRDYLSGPIRLGPVEVVHPYFLVASTVTPSARAQRSTLTNLPSSFLPSSLYLPHSQQTHLSPNSTSHSTHSRRSPIMSENGDAVSRTPLLRLFAISQKRLADEGCG
jgi:hypothetical protein